MQPANNDIPIRDIHLPDPVSWWPPAMGWWFVLLLICALALAIAWYIKRRKQFKVKKLALKELHDLHNRYLDNNDAKYFVKNLSVLLRRICISQFAPQQVAGLVGKNWLRYLDKTLSPKKNKSGHKFSDTMGLVLLDAPYSNTSTDQRIDVEALYLLATEWVNSLGPLKQPPQLSRNPSKNHSNRNKGVARVSI